MAVKEGDIKRLCQFDGSDSERIDQRAKDAGLTFAAYIRLLVKRDLNGPALIEAR